MEYYLNENFLIPPDVEIKKRLIKAITDSDIEMELIIDKKSIDRNTYFIIYKIIVHIKISHHS